MKSVIVNADDIGLHPAIDDAVLRLAEQGAISSAGVMTLQSPDRATLQALQTMGVDCGLHLDLTTARAAARLDGRPGLKPLMLSAWSRQLDSTRLRQLINDQLDAFEAIAGQPPRFVDGHEHVHQFPVVRDVLLSIISARYAQHGVCIRNTSSRQWRGVKSEIIARLGASRLSRLAQQHGFAMNSDFAGVYGLNADAPLLRLWSQWLASLPAHGGIVVCHPATAVIPDDSHAQARLVEFQLMGSSDWKDLLVQLGITVATWRQALAPSLTS